MKKHKYSNIFKNIGTSDITYLIDFEAIFLSNQIISQKDFLLQNGIQERSAQLINENPTKKIKIIADFYKLVYTMGDLFKVMLL